jgi:hypothetical protein
MLVKIYIFKSNIYEVETSNHNKNGAAPKSQMSRQNKNQYHVLQKLWKRSFR